MVFLDLRRNEYSCLNWRNTKSAIPIVNSLSLPDDKFPSEADTIDSEHTQRVANALAQKGILTQDSTNGKEAACVFVQAPNSAFASDDFELGASTRPGHWLAFFFASARASLKLRWFSMHRTVQSVKVRKDRHRRPEVSDDYTLRQLVAVFHQLRPFYGRRYRCLYDSLALIEFLAHYRFYPKWVFGVTAEPFNAHCWVQLNECILNDTVERVGCYTPIMVI